MNSALRLLLVLGALCALSLLSRLGSTGRRAPGPMWGFWPHLAQGFWGRRLAWTAGAFVVTGLFVALGLDRTLQDHWQQGDLLPRPFLRSMLSVGEYWAPAVALGLLGAGWMRGGRLRLAGSAATQAVLVGLVATLALKLLSGRRGPLNPRRGDRAPFPKVESDADFAFDFWNRTFTDGRFFWPSGHTLSSMVLVTALAAGFPERRWIPWVGYPLVIFMAVGMVDGDFHWTSDALAALLIGWPLGRTVGAAYREAWSRRGPPTAG